MISASFPTTEPRLRTVLQALAARAAAGDRSAPAVVSEVDLFLPFKALDQRRVLVHTHLQGVTLNRPGGTIAATELTGDADVDGAQVARAEVRGKLKTLLGT